MNQQIKNQNGIAAILTIVIVGAAALLMAYSASFLGLGDLEIGYDAQQAGEALAIADGCAEEALRRLKLDANYAGETLNLGDGSCIITVLSSGNNRIVTATSALGNYHKTVEVDVDVLAGEITFNSWQEKSN